MDTPHAAETHCSGHDTPLLLSLLLLSLLLLLLLSNSSTPCRAPFGVRWCAECEDWHPTSKGEVWAHWTPGPLVSYMLL
jgi:hypothetical protein